MKNLLFKEFKLAFGGQAFLFMLFSCFVAIPTWPTITGFIYPFIGAILLFPIAIANRDMEFTSLLPIRKSDIVKGKMLLTMAMELLSLVWSIPFSIAKHYINLSLGSDFPDLGVNFALYGLAFLMFGVLNAIFYAWAFKRPFKVTAPQMVCILLSCLFNGAVIVVFVVFPQLSIFLNDWNNPLSILVQLLIFFFGVLAFFVLSPLGGLLGQKRFEKIDL